MVIDADFIIKAGASLGALAAIAGLIYKIIRWVQRQKEQDEEIIDVKEEIASLKEELCLMTYGVLACLKGLKEQGCDGPVTNAIDKIEKHINQQAHDLKKKQK